MMACGWGVQFFSIVKSAGAFTIINQILFILCIDVKDKMGTRECLLQERDRHVASILAMAKWVRVRSMALRRPRVSPTAIGRPPGHRPSLREDQAG